MSPPAAPNLLRIGGDRDDPAFAGAAWVARIDDAPANPVDARRPDVVVLDTPADGASAIARVRVAFADSAALAIVGAADADAAWLAEADAVLVRPFAPAELRSTLRLLGRASGREADGRAMLDFRALFDVIDEGFCIVEMVFDDAARPVDYRILDYNAAYERFTGLVGSRGRLATEVAPGLEPHWFEFYGGVARTGEPARFVRHASVLHDRWFDVRAFRMGGPGSRRVAILFADVTEARRSEQALARSEARLRTIADHIPALVAHVDTEQRYTFANAAYERMLGRPASTMLGLTIRDVVGPTAHDLRRAELERSLREGAALQFEGRLPLADGGELFTLTSYVPERAEDGSVAGLYVLALDITDRVRAEQALRESEARFRTIADAMPQIVWVTTPDGAHVYYNRRWYEYVGTADGDNDGGRWADPLHPDDRDRSRARWRHSLDTGEPYEIEYRLRRDDGTYRWFLGLALPARDADGAITHWYGTCTDIDDQRRLRDERDRLLESERAARLDAERAREEAERAREDAERAGRLKDEFLATLSHELRTPLSAMLGWSQVLQRSAKLDDLRAGLATIERNARAQSQIIEDLLDMSRIVSGKIRLEVQPADLAALCRAAVDTVRPAAEAREVRIEAAIDADAGPIHGDPARLGQVLWNLLSNAVKFTPRGGRVDVTLARVGPHVVVRVADTGEGIAPAFLPFVFDRFRQADGSSTRRHGGLGLGLSICKQLVELHGGTIRAESAGAGHGSTFTVTLPSDAPARAAATPAGRTVGAVAPPSPTAPDAARSADARSMPVDEGPALGGVRVLVVDDEPDARELARHVLAARGATVEVASSAAEALARLDGGVARFDVLVSDVGMPDLDGHGLIRRLRSQPAGRGGATPAIALTAYATADDRARALAAGFHMHLSKPVEPAELVAAVATMAGRGAATS